jgi:hypothetical protein
MVRSELLLRRHGQNWSGGGARELSSDKGPPDGVRVTLDDYVSAHDEMVDVVEKCDGMLRFAWHASISGQQISTFAKKTKWRDVRPKKLEAFLTSLGVDKSAYEAALVAHILPITTSSSVLSDSNRNFYFNADNAVGAYIRTFSPYGDDEFSKEIFLRFVDR